MFQRRNASGSRNSARSDVARNDVVRNDVGRNDVVRNDVGRNDVVRNDVGRSGIGSDVSRSGVGSDVKIGLVRVHHASMESIDLVEFLRNFVRR
jgi:hypothetical protein